MNISTRPRPRVASRRREEKEFSQRVRTAGHDTSPGTRDGEEFAPEPVHVSELLPGFFANLDAKREAAEEGSGQ